MEIESNPESECVKIRIVSEEDFRERLRTLPLVSAYREARAGFGADEIDIRYLAELLRIPHSLCFAIQRLCDACDTEEGPAPDALDSISLFSLLKGLYLPLSGMEPNRIARLFRVRSEGGASCDESIREFLAGDFGLGLTDKIAYLAGDPFCGGNSRIGQDTLLAIVARIRLTSLPRLRERLSRTGDIGTLLLEESVRVRSDPPITAREAMVVLRALPDLGTNERKDVLCDLLARAGRLERYFLARLLLRRLNFGYEYRTQTILRALAERFGISEATLENAVALADLFEVARILEEEGEAGLKKLVLKPLNPVSPALAGNGEIDQNTEFPLWVECKYDGIRLLLHKESDRYGRARYAAFTRRKYDWLDMVSNLEAALAYVPAASFILDGELHGMVGDWEGRGMRQATMYEIYRYIQGATEEFVRLQYVAFDILYLNGMDLTGMPFARRRAILEPLLALIDKSRLPLPIFVSEGWEVNSRQEFQKWYQYFRTRGHEGAIAKKPGSLYSLGKRTSDWLKKKEAEHLDLAITGAIWAVSERGPQTFGAYLLSCRGEEGRGYMQIGRAQGLEREKNFEIVRRIASEGLLTGRTIEEHMAGGVQRGVELLPSMIATVRFEDVTRSGDGRFSLRDPKIVHIRPHGDMGVEEIDDYQSIRRLYLERRLQ